MTISSVIKCLQPNMYRFFLSLKGAKGNRGGPGRSGSPGASGRSGLDAPPGPVGDPGPPVSVCSTFYLQIL